MTNADINDRIRKLNESTIFQFVGRFAAVFAAVVMAPLTVWAITILLTISNDVAVLKTQVATALTDPYKGADAKRDFARRDDALRFFGESLSDVKGRVNTLEYQSATRRGQPQP